MYSLYLSIYLLFIIKFQSEFFSHKKMRDLDILKLQFFVFHNTDTSSFPLFTYLFLRYNKQFNIEKSDITHTTTAFGDTRNTRSNPSDHFSQFSPHHCYHDLFLWETTLGECGKVRECDTDTFGRSFHSWKLTRFSRHDVNTSVNVD